MVPLQEVVQFGAQEVKPRKSLRALAIHVRALAWAEADHGHLPYPWKS